MEVKADPVYSKIVTAESDLIGYLAFSLYMKEKVETIKAGISEAELVSFEKSCLHDPRIKSYRDMAAVHFNNFLMDNAKTISDEINKEHYKTLQDLFEKNKDSFLRKLGESLLILVCTSVALVALYFAVKLFGIDLLDALGIKLPEK